MSEHIHHVTDATFKSEVLESSVPVLVDYWAEWCGPCKMIAPILDEVAKDYAGKLKIAKLNIDENQKTPGEYGIRGIPTLMLFKAGNVEATKIGAVSKSQLTAFIDTNPRRTSSTGCHPGSSTQQQSYIPHSSSASPPGYTRLIHPCFTFSRPPHAPIGA